MILPKVLALGVQLMIPVVDSVPTLNVEQVCTGIAQQGGVTFHDSAIAQEKKDCLDSEQAIRDELAKQWTGFNASDKVHCTNESTMGGEFELHRAIDLPGNGPRCAGHAHRRAAGCDGHAAGTAAEAEALTGIRQQESGIKIDETIV